MINCDKQIGRPHSGHPILLSLVWLNTELDSTQSYYHYLLVVKNKITTFLNFFIIRPKYNLYFTWATITKKCIQFICMLFTHFHTSTIETDKALFTLAVLLLLSQTNSVVMSVVVKRSYFQNCYKNMQLSSTMGKKEIPKLYHSSWVPVGSTGCPGGWLREKQMIITNKAAC